MPATPLQVRLWTLERNSAPDPAWNVAVRFHLSGSLNREKLESALQFLIARHEALRTSLTLHRDAIVEYIAERRSLPVEWCDLRAFDGEAQTAEAMRLSLEHARQVLPLGSAPLFRVRVLRLRDDEHLMLWNAHHAVCDGWSVGLLAGDLMDIYGDLLAGRESAPGNSLDYGDYAVWLDEQRRTPEYEAHRSYWKRRLREFRIPELPPSWRNPDSEPTAPVIHSRLLSRALTDRLTAVSQRHNATFFHAALSVFALLLRAQQQSAEVAVGTPVSGRDQSELEDIVGTFVNYVPLRFCVEGDKHYIDLLHSIRELVTDSLEHSQFRFEDMLADLAQSGGLAQSGDRISPGDRIRPATDCFLPPSSASRTLSARSHRREFRSPPFRPSVPGLCTRSPSLWWREPMAGVFPAKWTTIPFRHRPVSLCSNNSSV